MKRLTRVMLGLDDGVISKKGGRDAGEKNEVEGTCKRIFIFAILIIIVILFLNLLILLWLLLQFGLVLLQYILVVIRAVVPYHHCCWKYC